MQSERSHALGKSAVQDLAAVCECCAGGHVFAFGLAKEAKRLAQQSSLLFVLRDHAGCRQAVFGLKILAFPDRKVREGILMFARFPSTYSLREPAKDSST